MPRTRSCRSGRGPRHRSWSRMSPSSWTGACPPGQRRTPIRCPGLTWRRGPMRVRGPMHHLGPTRVRSWSPARARHRHLNSAGPRWCGHATGRPATARTRRLGARPGATSLPSRTRRLAGSREIAAAQIPRLSPGDGLLRGDGRRASPQPAMRQVEGPGHGTDQEPSTHSVHGAAKVVPGRLAQRMSSTSGASSNDGIASALSRPCGSVSDGR